MAPNFEKSIYFMEYCGTTVLSKYKIPIIPQYSSEMKYCGTTIFFKFNWNTAIFDLV